MGTSIMSKEVYLRSQAQLIEALGNYYQNDNEVLVSIICGYNPDGVFGWHVIQSDYPHYSVLLLGESFDKALATAQEWAQEAEEDDEEDEDDGE